jgi:hypothetical protein
MEETNTQTQADGTTLFEPPRDFRRLSGLSLTRRLA